MSAAEVLATAMDAELDEHGYEDDDEKRGQVAHHFAAHQLDALGAAGYLVVKLPEPYDTPITFDDQTRGLGIWKVGQQGRVHAWSDGYMTDENGTDIGGIDVARGQALALLAAVNAIEAVSTNV